jgi:hypothetical protein
MTPIRALLLIGLFVVPAWPAGAHDIPSDVRVQLFVKAEGAHLRLLARMPIAAMNDVDWPTAGVMLDLHRVAPLLADAATAWIGQKIDLYEGERRLAAPRIAAVRISLPADQSFAAYDAALAHLTGNLLSDDTEVVARQAWLDALLEYPIAFDQSQFSVDPRFATVGLQTLTTLRFFGPSGVERAFQFHDDPGLVRLDPRWFQAARRFVADGFVHILGGIDHLLFLFALVIPFRRLRTLVPIVTAFTVAHSVTLIASAYDMAPDALWFPPLVETLIAASIVYMALENILAPPLTGRARRWMVAFGFGLVHGFGFSFALRDTLQFAGTHLLTSLLSFNVGVELGQVLVLAALVPALELLFRYAVAERAGSIVLSAFVAHTGWHWMIDRGSRLRLYQFSWPTIDAASMVLVLRWLIVAVSVAAAAWLIFGVMARRAAAGGRTAGGYREWPWILR